MIKKYKLGIDVGSTTVKVVLLNEKNDILFSRYARHMSNIFEKVTELVEELHDEYPNISASAVITGSGGLSLSHILDIPFEQEVITCSKAVETFIPKTDVAIELGGEDAKITFYGSTIEQRMNGTCAGGTGAFIDQMAVLLSTDAAGVNEYAKDYQIIYPIAARCGVFAKTDIQPLINEGAKKEDIAVSIFQAVVNQTISGLACGRPIKGNVAFLGGPLFFMGELRKRFIETLGMKEENIIFPDNSQYYVAMGAALISEKYEQLSTTEVVNKVRNSSHINMDETKHLDSLFKDFEEYQSFVDRHAKAKAKRKDIKKAKGETFLGIDAGSTTTKGALIDREGNLLYDFYQNNEGSPLEATKKMLREVYAVLPHDAYIAHSTVTGYGEGLIKAAYHVDHGSIETMAHYKASDHFMPGVEFILDIGGQDMKCIEVKDGAIYNIMLNEACSSGCGSFLEAYSKSVNMDIESFAKEGLFAKSPVDLGTRCTVFMNSKVKQAQKEGSTVGDISAGLSYSVIKNALYKVIKLRNPEEAGEKIVVQGGTFLNNSVLKSIENILGKEVVRPDIAGLMGAFGAAIISKEKYIEGTRSSIITLEQMEKFKTTTSHTRCKLCNNNCLLTINKFSNGEKFITGNRCERGSGGTSSTEDIPNLYQYKFKRLFEYQPLEEEYAQRGTVGIPKVLNMYENYPFWFTFFTKLGFRVVLSPTSSKDIYKMGMDTISSDTACYPAKLVHGHIKWLVENDVSMIFYPSINHERIEDDGAPNHYNCPIVATYPEVIANNMDDIFEEYGVKFFNPFLPYDSDDRLIPRLYSGLRELHVSLDEVKKAVEAARLEDERFKSDIIRHGKDALDYIKEHKIKGVVLAGRPYHVDPEINHGIDQVINSFGMAVLTEDSVSSFVKLNRPIRVLDQWMYHSRMYKAAEFVGADEDLELVQLNSFGCGLDAVTTDQVEEILRNKNKLYTLIKIDEGSNLGAARIRLRSLKATIEEREKNNIKPVPYDKPYEKREFMKADKERCTILIPQMAPIHFRFVETAINAVGYKAEVLPPVDIHAVEEGLMHINNDACFPTIVSLGQVISALKSGKYDLDNIALVMSQTGGGCRASNYLPLLRKALTDMNLSHIPAISFNASGLEKHEGFKITFSLVKKGVIALLYGDLFMRLLYKTRPYELEEGAADALYEKWAEIVDPIVEKGSFSKFKKSIPHIVKDFDTLALKDIKKPKVGVVGEILVKYHPTANNDIVGVIEKEGGEAVVPDLIDFFLYGMYSKEYNFKYLSGKYATMLGNSIAIKLLDHYRDHIRKALEESERFEAPLYITELAEKSQQILSLGNQCGEGWLLTAEMMELMDSGVENIVCLQPFACLPNHVTGKGMIKSLRKYNEKANIAAIDYDPGASEVNQLNRIKLMMATAFKNLEDAEVLMENNIDLFPENKKVVDEEANTVENIEVENVEEIS